MRLDFGGKHFVLVWTEDQYRNEVVRLMQGITTTTVKLVRTKQFLGLRIVVLRRIQAKPRTTTPGTVG
jgi:hypothetical protein